MAGGCWARFDNTGGVATAIWVLWGGLSLPAPFPVHLNGCGGDLATGVGMGHIPLVGLEGSAIIEPWSAVGRLGMRLLVLGYVPRLIYTPHLHTARFCAWTY